MDQQRLVSNLQTRHGYLLTYKAFNIDFRYLDYWADD